MKLLAKLELLGRKLNWKVLLGLTVFGLLLSACDNSVPVPGIKPEITLSVDKNSVSSGASVTLTVAVTKGSVTSVTFKRDKGAAIPSVTKPNAEGNFVTNVTITEPTIFSAEATGAGGTAQSKAVTVATTPVQDPVAVSQAFITYRDIALIYGATPTDFAAVSPVTVEGIQGDVEAVTDQSTAGGGKVTLVASKDALVFTYKPAIRFTGTDSFEYTVSSGGKTATATITVDVKPLDPKISVANSLSDTTNLPEAQTIVLTKQIFCNVNPCIRLKNNQTLTGSVVTTDGVTLTSPKAGIDASIPNTRRSGEPPSTNGSYGETRVIELADDTRIESIEITSTSTNERNSYFTAIFGRTDGSSSDNNISGSSGNLLSGDITIKNVTITRSNGKPIYMKYGDGSNYGNYNLLIEGLDLNDANDTLVIGNAKTLVFKDSNIELLQPVGEPVSGDRSFGDNAGTQIYNATNGNITLDNVDVFMENTYYEINTDGQNNNAVPFEIVSDKVTTSTLTVKNCDITFGDIISGADSAAFKVKGDGGGTVNINESASINNTSKEGSSNAPGINRIGNVNGTIEFN